MTDRITVTATIEIPIKDIVDAVGPEVSRTLIAGSNRKIQLPAKPQAKAVYTAIERVVSALDHLERAAMTVGEPAARQALMDAVKHLRKIHIRNRNG
jgi:hypothetical protein